MEIPLSGSKDGILAENGDGLEKPSNPLSEWHQAVLDGDSASLSNLLNNVQKLRLIFPEAATA